MRVLTQLFTHPFSVEPLSGEGTFGRTYGDALPLLCMVHGKNTLVRNAQGDEVVSRKTLYTFPGPAIPEQSRVTIDDEEWTVVARSIHELPGPLAVILELNLG